MAPSLKFMGSRWAFISQTPVSSLVLTFHTLLGSLVFHVIHVMLPRVFAFFAELGTSKQTRDVEKGAGRLPTGLVVGLFASGRFPPGVGQRGPEVFFLPIVFLEAWGTKS